MKFKRLSRLTGMFGLALFLSPSFAADPILIGASITQSPPGSVV